MICEIISVGTEVVTGDIIDTNAPYLSKELVSLGMKNANFAVDFSTDISIDSIESIVDRSGADKKCQRLHG